MSTMRNGVFFIEPEAAQRCELCGAEKECRPYGPNGEQICFACGTKDEKTTRAQFARRLAGKPPRRRRALMLVLLVLGCGGADLPPVGSDCGCENRGLILSEDGQRIDRICQRVTHLNPDGGVEWPDCSAPGAVCCAWGKP